MTRVAVVGAGLSGASCASVLRARGLEVDLIERSRAPGGRMASPDLHGRRVDIGAAYFTAKEPDFLPVVEHWRARGLVREWTDTFDVYSARGYQSSSGPMRYGTPNGLRSLVRDVLDGDVRLSAPVAALDELDHDALALAMPDPQAARLLPESTDWVDYDPVIAVVAGWPHRRWAMSDAAFVNDDADLSFVADDGSRRGDGAAVLVAHTTADLARTHLSHPDDAIAPVLDALRRVMAVRAAPEWSYAHRWTFAKPVNTHGDKAFELDMHGGRPVGRCGDAWCPSGAPRVESAWSSGRRLGAALADRLGH